MTVPLEEYLAKMQAAMRNANRQALAASNKWKLRDAALDVKHQRSGYDPLDAQMRKDDDRVLKGHYATWKFWTDECNRLCSVMNTELAMHGYYNGGYPQ